MSEFSSWYASLEKKGGESPDVFRVFARKESSYYTVHGKAALFVADEFFKTRDVVTYSSELAGVNCSVAKINSVLKRVLTEKKCKVELWEYGKKSSSDEKAERVGGSMEEDDGEEDGDAADDSDKKDLEGEGTPRFGGWRVVKKASPGDMAMLRDMIPADVEGIPAMGTMAVKITTGENGERVVGCAIVNTTMKQMFVSEFVDNERFSNLEAVLTQKNVSECTLLCDGKVAVEMSKVQLVFAKLDVTVAEAKSSDFRRLDDDKVLSLVQGGMEVHLKTLECKNAVAALSCLINSLELLSPASASAASSSFGGKFTLQLVDLSGFMRLDKSAMDALNLFPAAGQSAGDKNMSLFGVLNKTRTPMGSRLLYEWLKQPLLDEKEIAKRHDVVQSFVEDAAARTSVQDSLRSLCDLDRVTKKVLSNKGALQDMMQLYTFSLRLPGIKSGLEQLGDSKFYAGIEEAFVKPISNSMDDLVNFEKMTETTIDIDACKRHEFLINPSYSATLTRLSAEKENLLHDMEGLTEEMNEDLAFDKAEVKLVRGGSHGYHFRVSRKNEKSLRSNKQLTLLETRKDGVKFTSISLKKVSRQYEDLSKQYDEQQDAIAQKALEVVKTYVPVFEGLNEIIARMDVLLAFAHVSAVASPSFTRPLMQKRGFGCIKLQGARHPCVEMMDNVSFIANDAELVRGESNVQVITGPNMGGKSTYIRQTGVVVLLAQIGCFVPCDSAEISVVDAILARVGAGDSQMKGVSTFMKEMMEASTILRSSTSDSLVIIDELGRGTSTYDGFGLAWAIAEYIATQIGAFAMFATHFHELTALASAHKNVVNKHVTAHTTDSSITMLYKIHDGPCDRSFGIHVAEIANFPQQVVEMARQKAAELESFGNSVDLADIVQLAKSAGDGGDGRNGEGLMHDKEIAENRKRPLHVKDEASVVAKKAKGDDAESLCAVVLEDFKSIPLDTLSEPVLKKTLEEFRRRAKEALSI